MGSPCGFAESSARTIPYPRATAQSRPIIHMAERNTAQVCAALFQILNYLEFSRSTPGVTRSTNPRKTRADTKLEAFGARIRADTSQPRDRQHMRASRARMSTSRARRTSSASGVGRRTTTHPHARVLQGRKSHGAVSGNGGRAKTFKQAVAGAVAAANRATTTRGLVRAVANLPKGLNYSYGLNTGGRGFYTGITTDPATRFADHVAGAGAGSTVTAKAGVTGFGHLRVHLPGTDMKRVEAKEYYRARSIYGDRARGAGHTNSKTLGDCFTCGASGHWSPSCPRRS